MNSKEMGTELPNFPGSYAWSKSPSLFLFHMNNYYRLLMASSSPDAISPLISIDLSQIRNVFKSIFNFEGITSYSLSAPDSQISFRNFLETGYDLNYL